jgi:hypothetical protein
MFSYELEKSLSSFRDTFFLGLQRGQPDFGFDDSNTPRHFGGCSIRQFHSLPCGYQIRTSLNNQVETKVVDSMTADPFQPGFRFSFLDALVLAIGCGITIFFIRSLPSVSITVMTVVGHFFLFCNVLRMRRSLELTWAIIFIAIASSTLIGYVPWWLAVVVISSLTTMTSLFEVSQRSYHGVGWQLVNPELPEWWRSHMGRQCGSVRKHMRICGRKSGGLQ